MHITPSFENVPIIEVRNYSQYFDEPVNVYNEHYKSMFHFTLSFDFNINQGSVDIPNCGGQVDSVPSSFNQQEWTLSAVQGLSVQQTWATSWMFTDKESYLTFIAALTENKAALTSLHYTLDISALHDLLSFIFEKQLTMKKIWLFIGSNVHMFDSDSSVQSAFRTLSTTHNNSQKDFCSSLCEILKTDLITMNSNLRIDIDTTTLLINA